MFETLFGGCVGEGDRAEVGMVRYQYNVLGTRGPRKMTVIIPRPGGNGGLPFATEADGSMTARCSASHSRSIKP